MLLYKLYHFANGAILHETRRIGKEIRELNGKVNVDIKREALDRTLQSAGQDRSPEQLVASDPTGVAVPAS